MADSHGTSEVLVEHAPAIAHLQSLLNPDGSYRFQFISTVVINGRCYGRFLFHPELSAEEKRFTRRHNILRKHFKNQPRDYKAPLLSSDLG